jgi:hypothetical protein
MSYEWEHWPEVMRIRHGRNVVVDALLQCHCKAAVLRGEPTPGPCACMGPPDSVARVVRAEDVEELLRIQRETLTRGEQEE